MTGQTKFETLPYRLIITRYGGNEVLLCSSPPSLPSLDVSWGGRPAEGLVTGIEWRYRLETYCLWVRHDTVADGNSLPGNDAVMEVLEQNRPAPTGMFWAPTCDAVSKVGSAGAAGIRAFIEDLERYGTDPEREPFAQPGWIQNLLSWAGAQLPSLGLRLTGGFWQLNAGPSFSLIRLQTNRAPVWFKATGEPNAHELPASLTLARLIPEYVPRILGVHPSWNGWLSSHVPGRLLCGLENHSAWETVAGALARLQVASIEKGNELPESKVRDLGTRRLAELVDPFIDCMSRLMKEQEKQSPAPLTPVGLAAPGRSQNPQIHRTLRPQPWEHRRFARPCGVSRLGRDVLGTSIPQLCLLRRAFLPAFAPCCVRSEIKLSLCRTVGRGLREGERFGLPGHCTARRGLCLHR